MSILDSIDPYLRSCSENNMSDHTIRAYRADLLGFQSCLVGLETEAMSWKELEGYAKIYLKVIGKNWAARTTQRKISTLKSWAAFNGQPDFLASYRGPKPAKAQPHPVPEGIQGVLLMVDAANLPHHRMLVVLCGLMGLRVAEALEVRSQNFNEVERTCTVHGKGDKYRVVPVSNRAWDILVENGLMDRPGTSRLVTMSDRVARRLLTRLAERANLTTRVASHDLRSTFATAAYDKTGDLRAVQELLGHADSRTTEIYTRVSMTKMRRAAEVA